MKFQHYSDRSHLVILVSSKTCAWKPMPENRTRNLLRNVCNSVWISLQAKCRFYFVIAWTF